MMNFAQAAFAAASPVVLWSQYLGQSDPFLL